MKRFHVKLKGLTPYMQHRMDDAKLDAWEQSRGQIIERPDVDHADAVRAMFHAHIDASGHTFVPADQIRLALVTGGTYLKSKVGTKAKSMKGIVAAMFMVYPDQVPIVPYDLIDKRSAVNRAIKGRVMVVRPKWSAGWEIEFELQIGEQSVTKQTVKDLLEVTGNYVGIGSYRPTNNGNFGRFEIIELQELNAPTTTGRERNDISTSSVGKEVEEEEVA